MPRVSKRVRSLMRKAEEQRLIRLRHQNAKLRLEVGTLKGRLVPFEQIKREVTTANVAVRNQMLGLADRLTPTLVHLTDSAEVRQVLRAEILTILNDLAYERERKERADEHTTPHLRAASSRGTPVP